MVPKGYDRVSPLVESVLLPNKTEADELIAVSERMGCPLWRDLEREPHLSRAAVFCFRPAAISN